MSIVQPHRDRPPKTNLIILIEWMLATLLLVLTTGTFFVKVHAHFLGAAQEPYTPSTFGYGGVDGTIDYNEFIQLTYLAFPQSYAAIKNRFGLPAERDTARDYYHYNSTTKWIAIVYNSNGVATGYEISE